MNEVIKQLYERKSVRVFEDREITKEDKFVILESATMAPTAGNQQLYTILDITDQMLKEQLVETCDHQPFIAQAKMVLIFCADCQKWYDGFKVYGCNPRKPAIGDLMLAVCDANIAAQNAVVAAHSLGIGSCYIGDIMENCEIMNAQIVDISKTHMIIQVCDVPERTQLFIKMLQGISIVEVARTGTVALKKCSETK